MAVKLVISPDRSWCTDKILALVNWSPSSLPRKDILWLVPSGRAAEHLRRRLLEKSIENSCPGVFLPDIKLLAGWTEEIYRRMGGGHAVIEDREIIIQHLVESSAYLKGSHYPGIIAKIAQFVGQVKRNSLSAEKLSARMRSFNRRQTGNNRLSQKDKFLLEILENYQNFLDDKTAIDRDDTVLWLRDLIIREKRGLMDYLGGYKTLILDGFYYLAPSEEALVGDLIQNFPQTIISIHANPPGISNCEANCSISDGSFLDKIRKNHSYEVEEETAPPTDPPTVFYDNPTNRVEEVRALARGIKATLLKNPDIPTYRLGVVFPSPDIYAPLVHEIFPQYGIACQLGIKLSRSPITYAYKKMLDLRCDGFLLDDLEKFFSCRFITPLFSQEGRAEFIRALDIEQLGGPEFDFPRFADFCRVANISGGGDFVKDWLEPLRKYLKARPGKTDSESALNRSVVGNSLFYLKQFHAYIWRLPNSLTPADFQDIILDLTRLMQIPRNLLCLQENQDRSIRQTRNLAAFNRIREILGQMTSQLQFLAQPKPQYPLSTLRKLFLRFMARSEVYLNKHENNISVMGLSETGGLCFDELFMGGLVEGELPQARESNIFYRDGSGKFFDQPDRSEESKYLYQGLLDNCSGPIHLFAPKASNDKILFPSSLIDANWPHPEKSEDIYSHSELMERIALTRDSPSKCRELQDILQKTDPQALEHSLLAQKIENMRAAPEPSHYQGTLQDPENLVRLKERFTYSEENPCHYSVSQLEEYARCPMQYFMDRILTLKPVPEITEEMEADERGKLVHKILEKYYRGITDDELADQDALFQRLRRIANRVFDKWAPPYHNAFWEVERKKLLSGMDGEDRPGILLRFWWNEKEQLQYSHPVDVEFSFGEENDYFCVGDIRLVGRVDRVDHLYETGSYLFFDYKTGKIPDLEDIAKGLSFQLPVYLMALADHYKKEGSHLATGAGGYYAVGEKEVKIKAFYGSTSMENYLYSNTKKSRFYNDSDLNDEFHTIRDRIRTIDQDIKDGKFPLPQQDPKDIQCKWCDYKKICRYSGE